MGLFMSKTVEDPVKRQQDQQEIILEMQTLQIERQIYMRYLMHQRMLALKIANARELFLWLTAFYTVSSVGLLVGYQRTKTVKMLVPMVPLTFLVAYQGDLAYGSKLSRIKDEAENIMDFEAELLELPHQVPTVGGIDEARERTKDEQSFSKAHDIFL
ncbi:plasminogen receptor (KT)-like [Ornithodoros turicata]|uniref:Putative plasminogen receptor kt isoform x1 n=1 Tax=Ornithodoros turicata TaxID=34597 RepID=A0A2R5LG94_9ACAR